jgi:hypothetical protein
MDDKSTEITTTGSPSAGAKSGVRGNIQDIWNASAGSPPTERRRNGTSFLIATDSRIE